MKAFLSAAAAILVALIFLVCCLANFKLPQSTLSVRTAHNADRSSIMTGRDNITDPLDFYELLPGKVLININTADVAVLEKLPGIGNSLAEAIVEYRLQNGPFQKPEDIMLVSGIGEGKFTAMEQFITV